MDVAIVGIGIHPFGRTPERSGLDQGAYAVREALKDAGIDWSDIEFAYGGSDAAGNADTLVNQLGLTGIPFINVKNGCATGGSALISAVSAIKSGQYDVGIAVGFDKHPRGAFNADPEEWGIGKWYGETGMMLTTQFFAMKIQKYMNDHGISHSTLAKVAAKAFDNGALNPNAWRREPVPEDVILDATMVSHPLTKYMFCAPAEGAVALVLASRRAAARFAQKPVYLASAAFKTRRYGSFEVFSPAKPIEDVDGPTVEASRAAYEMAGIGPEDVDIAQLQDTESGAEVMHMAENGLCRDGEQEAMIQNGETRLNGRLPVNTDGGCLANGEPIGASGLRQVYENALQIRGQAGAHQVAKPVRVAYSHVYGAPGVSAVTILKG